MCNERRLLVLILDAFSDKYLDWASYINKLSEENFFVTISPLFAYEGIGTSILTGLSPMDSGIWHDKIFNPIKNRRTIKRTIFKLVSNLADRLSPNDDVNKIFRFAIFRLFHETYGTPHLIPINYLDYFATYTHKHKNIPDLFQILGQKGLQVRWVEPKLEFMEERILRNISVLLRKYNLIFLKLNSLDRLGHKYGPLSEKVKEKVRQLDRIIKESFNKLSTRYENVPFIIMSDHGMVPVEKAINIEKLMTKETSIRPLIDYVPYIGSTFASFFVFNKKAENIIAKVLDGLSDYGRTLEEHELMTFGINKELYGHIIFALNEKNVFFPNFFQRRNIPKGMHGYASASYDRPIFVTNITLYDRCKKSEIEFSKLHWLILREFLATE
jgi:hypothetical protein